MTDKYGNAVDGEIHIPGPERAYAPNEKVDRVLGYMEALGITLQPWQEAHLRALLAGNAVEVPRMGGKSTIAQATEKPCTCGARKTREPCTCAHLRPQTYIPPAQQEQLAKDEEFLRGGYTGKEQVSAWSDAGWKPLVECPTWCGLPLGHDGDHNPRPTYRDEGLTWCGVCARWYRKDADGNSYHGGCTT
jgi:hypothetical protein